MSYTTIGKGGKIEVDNSHNLDGDMDFAIGSGRSYVDINRDDAIELINHLGKVFDLIDSKPVNGIDTRMIEIK